MPGTVPCTPAVIPNFFNEAIHLDLSLALFASHCKPERQGLKPRCFYNIFTFSLGLAMIVWYDALEWQWHLHEKQRLFLANFRSTWMVTILSCDEQTNPSWLSISKCTTVFLCMILSDYWFSLCSKEYIQMQSVINSLWNSLIPARNREFFAICKKFTVKQFYSSKK